MNGFFGGGRRGMGSEVSGLPSAATEVYQGWKYWCLVLLATLLLGAVGVGPLMYPTGKTLWVDGVNGSDASGRRGVATSPYQTLMAAVTNAVAGDWVMTAAGQYDCGTNCILRVGVNYDLTHSTVTWSNGVNNANICGLLDDRIIGPTTNIIRAGKLFGINWRSDVDNPTANLRGLIVVTNAASEMHLRADRIEVVMLQQSDPGGFYWAVDVQNGQVFLDVDVVTDPYSSPDGGVHGSRAGGLYWEGGDFHVKAGLVDIQNYYGIWGHAVDGNSRANFWLNVDTISVGNQAAFYQDSSANNVNFKSWVTAQEIRSTNGIGVSCVGTNKVYVTAEKVSGSPAIASSSSLWLNVQKVASAGSLLSLSGGSNYVQVMEWEDLGTSSTAMTLSGGFNRVVGGVYMGSANSVVALLISGGTNSVEGMTIDTRVSGTTNAYPIVIAGATNTTLKDLVLWAPGALQAIQAYSNRVCKLAGVISVTNGVATNIAFFGGIISSNGYALPTMQRVPYVEAFSKRVTRYCINSGSAANLTALGDGATISATPALFNAATATNGPGVLVVAGGAGAFIISSVNGNLIYKMGREADVFYRGNAVTNTATVIIWLGLTDQAAAVMTTNNPAGNYAAFRYSTTAPDTTWKCVTKDNTTQTVTDSLVTVDNGNHTFEVRCMDLQNQVVFYIDDRAVQTNTANLPLAGTLLRYFGAMQTLTATTNAWAAEEFVMSSR